MTSAPPCDLAAMLERCGFKPGQIDSIKTSGIRTLDQLRVLTSQDLLQNTLLSDATHVHLSNAGLISASKITPPSEVFALATPSTASSLDVTRGQIELDAHVRSYGYRFFAYLEMAMKACTTNYVEWATAVRSWPRFPPLPTSGRDYFWCLRTTDAFTQRWKDPVAVQFVAQWALNDAQGHAVASLIRTNLVSGDASSNGASKFDSELQEIKTLTNGTKHAERLGGTRSIQLIIVGLVNGMSARFQAFFADLLQDMRDESWKLYATTVGAVLSQIDPRRDRSALILLSCPGDLLQLPHMRWALVIDVGTDRTSQFGNFFHAKLGADFIVPSCQSTYVTVPQVQQLSDSLWFSNKLIPFCAGSQNRTTDFKVVIVAGAGVAQPLQFESRRRQVLGTLLRRQAWRVVDITVVVIDGTNEDMARATNPVDGFFPSATLDFEADYTRFSCSSSLRWLSYAAELRMRDCGEYIDGIAESLTSRYPSLQYENLQLVPRRPPTTQQSLFELRQRFLRGSPPEWDLLENDNIPERAAYKSLFDIIVKHLIGPLNTSCIIVKRQSRRMCGATTMLRHCLSRLVAQHMAVGVFCPKPLSDIALPFFWPFITEAAQYGNIVMAVDDAESDSCLDNIVTGLRREHSSRKVVLVCVAHRCTSRVELVVGSTLSATERNSIELYQKEAMQATQPPKKTECNDALLGTLFEENYTPILWGVCLFLAADRKRRKKNRDLLDLMRRQLDGDVTEDHKRALRLITHIALFDCCTSPVNQTGRLLVPNDTQSTTVFDIPRNAWVTLKSAELLCVTRVGARSPYVSFRSVHIADVFLMAVCPTLVDLRQAALASLETARTFMIRTNRVGREAGTSESTLVTLIDYVRPRRVHVFQRQTKRQQLSTLFYMMKKRRGGTDTKLFDSSRIAIGKAVHETCDDEHSLYALVNLLTVQFREFDEARNSVAAFGRRGTPMLFTIALIGKRQMEHFLEKDSDFFSEAALKSYFDSSSNYITARAAGTWRPLDVKYMFGELPLRYWFVHRLRERSLKLPDCQIFRNDHLSFASKSQLVFRLCSTDGSPTEVENTRVSWSDVEPTVPSAAHLWAATSLVIERLTTPIFVQAAATPASFPAWMSQVVLETLSCMDACRAYVNELQRTGDCDHENLEYQLESLAARVSEEILGANDVEDWLKDNATNLHLPAGALAATNMMHLLNGIEKGTIPNDVRHNWIFDILEKWMPDFLQPAVHATFSLPLPRILAGLSFDYIRGTGAAFKSMPLNGFEPWRPVLQSAAYFCHLASRRDVSCLTCPSEWAPTALDPKARTPVLFAAQRIDVQDVFIVRRAFALDIGKRSYEADCVAHEQRVTPIGWHTSIQFNVDNLDEVGPWLRRHRVCNKVKCRFVFTFGPGIVRAIVVSCGCGALCPQRAVKPFPDFDCLHNNFDTLI